MRTIRKDVEQAKNKTWELVRSVVILMILMFMAGLVARGFWILANWGWTLFGTI